MVPEFTGTVFDEETVHVFAFRHENDLRIRNVLRDTLSEVLPLTVVIVISRDDDLLEAREDPVVIVGVPGAHARDTDRRDPALVECEGVHLTFRYRYVASGVRQRGRAVQARPVPSDGPHLRLLFIHVRASAEPDVGEVQS